MKDQTKHAKWVFDRNGDDIRGWPVRDANNKAHIGSIAAMMVDPETSYVAEVTLADGQRFAAADMRLGDKEVFVLRREQLASQRSPANLEVVRSAPEKESTFQKEPIQEKELAPQKPVAQIKAAPQASHAPIGAPITATAAPEPASVAASKVAGGDDRVLQLADEYIEVGKRRYNAGGVHVETHIVSEPFAKEVRLREEHVSVAREKVDRTLDSTAADRCFHDETFEVRARAERPAVEKQSHVVEEIVLKKDATTRAETVHDTVRRMDATVTDLRSSQHPQGGVR